MKNQLKTPISYYGGKQNMLKHILPLIPEHKLYTESFMGGGAVYWAKQPAKIEVINDKNREVVNFYTVLKTKFNELKQLVETTLHSRSLYKDAMTIYKSPHLFDDVKRAWAFWVCTNQGFANTIGSWGFDKTTGNKERKVSNDKIRFTKELSQRLERTQIECFDACRVIANRDSEHAFHYVDPPYLNADQGHYSGYTSDDFKNLLDTLSKVKGKFLLSSYEGEMLDEYIKANGWYVKKFDKPLSANKRKKKRKIEVLTANYPI